MGKLNEFRRIKPLFWEKKSKRGAKVEVNNSQPLEGGEGGGAKRKGYGKGITGQK